MEPIRQYAIYEHPSDHPDGYVVREWLIADGQVTPGTAWKVATLDEAHDRLPEDVEQMPVDDPDPTIIEVWM